MGERLTVSMSPHIHSGSSTKRIMQDVIIALIPAAIASVFIFGFRAIAVLVVTISAAILAEMLSRMVMKRDPKSVFDCSAVITGLLLGLSLPVTIPLWMAALGSAIAIVVVKEMFGGLGQNFVNPAMAGRVVLLLSYPAAMSAAWANPVRTAGIDAIASATPLAALANGELSQPLSELFFGLHPGSMGETSIFALFLGGIYLVWRRVISPVIPLTFIGTTLIFVLITGGDPIAHLLTGSLVFVAIFMATDYATSPLHRKGRIVFAIGCGLITGLIRQFAALPEGVSFAVIIMNILVPHIERLTTPVIFGSTKRG